jgi:hypothetical protein
MTKIRGAQQPPSEPTMRVRRKRSAVPAEANEAFVRAFVDALRDILHDEMRLVP